MLTDTNKLIPALAVTTLAATIAACGGGGSSSSAPADITYSTTSNRGDYSEWTLTDSSLDATWEVINGTGDVSVTYEVSADCGVPDSNGVQTCTISTGSCTDGVDTCSGSPSGDLQVMAVPGVALFVHSPDTPDTNEQLHVGFAKDSGACADDISGDYSYIRTGLSLDENFGVFRTDSNLVNIMHADFGFDTADMNATQTVAYRTGTESEALSDLGCDSGVRTRGLSGGETLRAMLTQSGLFLLDLPAGQGGLVAFEAANAATVADLANASWGGIAFPDNSGPELISATSGAASGGKVTFSATVGGNPQSIAMMDLGTTSTSTSPAYPDFTSTTDPTSYATMAVLHNDYASVDDIPGLFKMDNLTNTGDSGRVIMAAMKFDGKVIGVGMVYNYRTTSDDDLSNGGTFGSDGLYNTGNFILFQR